MSLLSLPLFFFFNDTAPTDIYTLSLHDALPISGPAVQLVRNHLRSCAWHPGSRRPDEVLPETLDLGPRLVGRSEEHTSELQSRVDLVCRLLLEKKKTK